MQRILSLKASIVSPMIVIISANRTGPRNISISIMNIDSEKNPITNSIYFYFKEFLERPYKRPDFVGLSNEVY
jgi:hypothetical protein